MAMREFVLPQMVIVCRRAPAAPRPQKAVHPVSISTQIDMAINNQKTGVMGASPVAAATSSGSRSFHCSSSLIFSSSALPSRN